MDQYSDRYTTIPLLSQITIENRNYQITKNFNETEIYLAKNCDCESFIYDKTLIIAAQYLRDLIKEPISVNSSKRDKKGNFFVGGQENSQHLLGRAIDLGNSKLPDIIKKAVSTRNKVYKDLRSLGINGFGIYRNFVHLDTREKQGKHLDKQYGNFAYWDDWKKKDSGRCNYRNGISFNCSLLL